MGTPGLLTQRTWSLILIIPLQFRSETMKIKLATKLVGIEQLHDECPNNCYLYLISMGLKI